jgi:low affinity Fe/Cu permease
MVRDRARSAGSHPTVNLEARFRRFAQASAKYLGSSLAFAGAVALVLIWAVAGPFYRFSDTWELVINTTTTIITFLMVFLIQSTQNRDALAIHLKLDELLRSMEGARNSLVDLENLSDEQMARLKKEFTRISQEKAGPLSGPTAPQS